MKIFPLSISYHRQELIILFLSFLDRIRQITHTSLYNLNFAHFYPFQRHDLSDPFYLETTARQSSLILRDDENSNPLRLVVV